MAQYCLTDTIFALASGAGSAGVAVIRISGSEVQNILKKITGLSNPTPRHAYFKSICDLTGGILDRGLVLYFNAPDSFTGEDVAELQIHGGRSVIRAVLRVLGDINGCRPAERGEFSRRAVLNGKMDLTQAEGLLDFIHADTDRQREQAFHQLSGDLKNLYESWRGLLIRHMAYLEAFIDFPEEEIPVSVLEGINHDIADLVHRITDYLDDNGRGQKLREGFQIALIGPPNAGKSSLINALTKKDVAIVSAVAGTTRDVVEAHLDVDGFPVILADTAGLREQADMIEAEGIRRAVARAEAADLILNVSDAQKYPNANALPKSVDPKNVIVVWNKADLALLPVSEMSVSALTGAGIGELWQKIRSVLQDRFDGSNTCALTHERYRVALNEAVQALERSLAIDEIELKAEELRLAARAVGRITGRIENDELLDVIFHQFCIGK